MPRTIARKIATSFAPAQARRILAMRRRILVGAQRSTRVLSSYARPPAAVTRPLLDAFVDRRVAVIRYQDQQPNVTEREIELQYLYYNVPVWYALVWDRLRDDVRFFRIDRIKNIQLGREQFQAPSRRQVSSPRASQTPRHCDSAAPRFRRYLCRALAVFGSALGDQRRQRRPQRLLGGATDGSLELRDRVIPFRRREASPSRDGLVVVMNTGEPSLVSFPVAPTVSNRWRPAIRLSASDTDSAQVGFSPDGSMVVITARYRLDPDARGREQ